jgi:GT2 family glycosyltransferase
MEIEREVESGQQALVSFVIVNWNGKDLLNACLESLRSQSYQSFEIILVDNGSSDGSSEFVRTHFPEVQLVELGENRGFAGGNNAGLAHCSGKYIALLNNDAELHSEWLLRMLAVLQKQPDVGLCSSRIYIKGTAVIDSVGDRFTTALTGTKLGENQKGMLFDAPVPIHGVCAAAAIYRKKMIEEIGFFDDDLFLNYEDTDLNMRAWLRGWKCLYVPEAIVTHAVNATIGRMSRTSVYYFSRNSLLVLIKNYPWRLVARQLPQRLFFEVCAFIYYAILNMRLIAYMRGKFDAFRLMPKFIKKRKQHVPFICLSDAEILSQLTPVTKVLSERLRSQG